MIAFVPLVVPWPLAPRQKVCPPTDSVSAPVEVWVQVWLAWPLQSQICCCVPPVVDEFGSSRHLPAPTACNAPVLPPPPPPEVPPATRYMTVPWAGTEALIVPLVVEVAPLHRSVRV